LSPAPLGLEPRGHIFDEISPANRGIVSTGAYRFVRHPIYTGIFIALAGFLLRSYTSLNVT